MSAKSKEGDGEVEWLRSKAEGREKPSFLF